MCPFFFLEKEFTGIPRIIIVQGFGMVAINCGTLIMPDGTLGNLFLDPMLSDTDALMNTMQIDFLKHFLLKSVREQQR